MSWLTDYLRPKIKDETIDQESTINDNLWEKCDKCGELEYKKNWISNLYICTHCGFHKKINIKTRLDMTMDDGYILIDLPKVKLDPIKFTDSKKYTDRIADAKKSGLNEAIAVAQGHISGQAAIVAVMDFAFIGGSMGLFVGEAIRHATNLAIAQKTPFICFTASGGARMQEGIYSLMQMPRTTLAVETLKSKGIPYINVLTNPTMGGVLASFAMLGDITIAEPDATIGFSGRRVVENTTREKLPDDFQTSQFQYNCGYIDQVVNRFEIKNTLEKILTTLNKRKN